MELSPWYFAIKLLAYSGWLYLGLAMLQPGLRRRAIMAGVLGALRLGMGLAFGLGIWLGGSYVYSMVRAVGGELWPSVATYALVYVPVRWVEWGIFEVAIHGPSRSLRGFVLGGTAAARRWRLGGILISCAADVPVLLVIGGLPLGRFMC